MNDYVVRIMTRTGNVLGLACVTTELVKYACQHHQTALTASVALGRALTGAAMMGKLLKGKQRAALKFEGNGPLQKILAEANTVGDVRGYVGKPDADVPLKNGKPDVASAIGKAGFLTVTKDLGLKEPYKGIVQLYTSEIAEDLAYYFVESEQIPSAVGLGVFIAPDSTVAAAGGFLIQSLPPADNAMIEQIVAHINAMPPITELLLCGKSPEEIITLAFAGIPYDILEIQPLQFQCSCSSTRMEQALIALGPEELSSLVEEGETELVCEFCRSHYHFGQQALERLLRQIQ